MAVRVVWRYRLQSYSTSVGLAVTGRVTTADGSGRDTVSGDRRMVSVVCLPALRFIRTYVALHKHLSRGR